MVRTKSSCRARWAGAIAKYLDCTRPQKDLTQRVFTRHFARPTAPNRFLTILNSIIGVLLVMLYYTYLRNDRLWWLTRRQSPMQNANV
eukprot:SAG31_NODE_3862_length_3810_cov_32.413096_2_plen_88_part_00